MLQVAVCGDSPIAHSVAAVCSWRGNSVRVLCTNPGQWRSWLRGRMPDGGQFVAPISVVTSDSAEAIDGAEIVIVCEPHANIEVTLKRIAPHVQEGMLMGGIPGFGGFGLRALSLLPGDVCMFGTQRIPFVIRKYEKGRSVNIGGVRRQTFVGTRPASCARAVAELIGEILGVRTVPVSHYLNIELSPSNSIVNPARLYSMFGPSATGAPSLGAEFFLDWNLAASQVLLAIDSELQLARRLVPRDTSFVAPILLQYDANDAATLTDRIRSLRALAGRPIPVRLARGAAVLDLNSDYVLEDVDVGLAIVRDMLRLAGAATPQMDAIVEWRQSLLPAKLRRAWARRPNPTRGFKTIEALARALD